MVSHTDGTVVKLSGAWNISGVVHQMESLSTWHHRESVQDTSFRIDCSEISSVDMSGLQLLHVWMQCVRFRGVTPELVNLPNGMRHTIKQLGLENCFADFYADVAREAGQDT